MKKFVQNILQRALGFRRYLNLFSWFKIKTLHWDKKEGDFLHFLSLLGPEDHVLDVGANIGIMTVHLARRCSHGQVHAFEPISENVATLNHVIARFRLDNVTLHPVALGAEPGELEMVMPEVENVRMQGLSHVVHESIPDFNEGTRYKVPVHRLDDLREHWGTIKGIKIDVENFEFFVFEGAQNLLREDGPVIYCELWDNENRQKCFDLLRGLDYRVMVLENGALTAFEDGRHTQQNFFFVK